MAAESTVASPGPRVDLVGQRGEVLGAVGAEGHEVLEAQAPKPDLVLYDSKDLVTHAVCVGMTGSGKTGLCITLIEEAAIDGVPSLIIDPKGVYGAPGFDIAAWMYNPPGVQDREDYRELAARRIAVCAEVWGIGQQELAAWAFAGTVLNACWSASGPAPAEWLVATLRVAEWLETLLD